MTCCAHHLIAAHAHGAAAAVVRSLIVRDVGRAVAATLAGAGR